MRGKKGINESTGTSFALRSGNVNDVQPVYIGILKFALRFDRKATSSRGAYQMAKVFQPRFHA